MASHEFEITVTVNLDDNDDASEVIAKLEAGIIAIEGVDVEDVESGDWWPA